MIRACILNLRAQGDIDAGRAQLFLDTFDELDANYRQSMSAAAAAAQATNATMQAISTDVARRRRVAALRFSTRRAIVDAFERNDAGMEVVAPALFDADERVRGVSNIESRRRAVAGKLHGMMAQVLETFDRDILGRVRQPALLRNVVREAFGENTGDKAARQLAQAWGEAAEYARQRFNMAGGHIGRIAHWGMPQIHDAIKVKAAGRDAWVDAVIPMLDLSQMTDLRTGVSFTPQALRRQLRETYDGIVTNGWDTRTLGSRGPGMLANQRAEHRFMIFRDADTWLEYQQRFGAGDTRGDPAWIFDTMMGHIDGMSRDIAAMEILGPDPASTVRWLENMLDKAAATDAIEQGRILTTASKANAAKYQIRTMWGLFSGELNRPVNAQMARGFSVVRSLQTAAKLGSAAITAITDVGFQMSTRAFNGIPAANTMAEMIAYMLPQVRAGEKAVAVRSGLLAEEAAARMGALNRYHEEFNTPGLAQRITSGVLRASGLSRWTQVGKWLYGMESMGQLADNAGRGFADIDAGLRLQFERYGISASDWDAIRSTPPYQQSGTAILRPDELAARTDLPPGEAERLSDALLEMIQSETRFAVPDAGLRAQAVTSGGVRPGTVVGEAVRSATQFKSFPISILFTHLSRAIHGRGAISRAHYAAHLMIGTTLLGAASHQIKQIIAGKDPAPMDDPRFWGQAMMQGGGAGIFGDFLFADQTRYGGGMAATMAGPLAGSIEGLASLTVGSIQKGAAGDDTNLGREVVRFLRSNTPGSSLWYTRLAMDRLIWSEMQRMMDEDFDAAQRRMIRRAEREFGQEYWWAPGESAPERAPDLSAAFGE